MLHRLNLQQWKGEFVGDETVGCCLPRGGDAPWNASAPEPSLRQPTRFAHLRTATQGSVSFFPFWLIKEKRDLREGILYV